MHECSTSAAFASACKQYYKQSINDQRVRPNVPIKRILKRCSVLHCKELVAQSGAEQHSTECSLVIINYPSRSGERRRELRRGQVASLQIFCAVCQLVKVIDAGAQTALHEVLHNYVRSRTNERTKEFCSRTEYNTMTTGQRSAAHNLYDSKASIFTLRLPETHFGFDERERERFTPLLSCCMHPVQPV